LAKPYVFRRRQSRHANRKFPGKHHPRGDGFAVQPGTVTGADFDRVPEGMAEIK
jgi:hypothetical protein